MGHYASEMEGPYDGPTNREAAEELVADLQYWWHQGLELFNSGHQGRDKRTCPQCFVQIDFLLMEKHDRWHEKLKRMMEDIARWTPPGLIG